MPLSRIALVLAGSALACVALAGCGGGAASTATDAAVVPSTSPPTTGPAPCPSPPASTADWPLAVPADLPKPPGAVITSSSVKDTATYVRFTTPTSLRDSVIFVVKEMTAAGYTLDRGDAEAFEADAPFTGPTVVGAMKMLLTAPCATSWVLAVVPRQTGATPAPAGTLIPYTPGSSASPLPFG